MDASPARGLSIHMQTEPLRIVAKIAPRRRNIVPVGSWSLQAHSARSVHMSLEQNVGNVHEGQILPRIGLPDSHEVTGIYPA